MAHIGLTEEDAVKRGYPIKISRLPASAIPRARTLQNMDGMLKAIVNTDTEKILGCSLFCVNAPELINLVAFAIKTGQKSSALRSFIFTHPSMSEGLNGLFKAF
jgi:pyruvate/2-oxoglutarate dehydrogenase complex dihydrolipoamide dehydrogenase (E3) component